MAYLTLYRKYRPTSFTGVIGQEHITTSLTNQIKSGTISHAYLFCGARGTGKTSVAKVFAKSINCLQPNNGSACFKCKTCLELENDSNLDVLEIDAASNNRVDEIRELRENVKYPPVNAKYKVYIIDEVHMLTDSAFNALLKTLEEPPAHVVFVLATTEVQKLPATILSRCLRFDFKLIGLEELEKHLEYIYNDSGVKFEKEAISLIAKLGEGSVRDMLSVADMCAAYTNNNVTYNAVLSAVGAIDKGVLGELATYILTGETHNLLSELNKIIESGKNISQISKDLANYFRDLAVVKTCENYKNILKYPVSFLQSLENQAKLSKIDIILKALKTYSGLDNDFRLTTNPRIVLEVASLNLCDEIKNYKTLEERVELLEKKKDKPMATGATTSEIVLAKPHELPSQKTIFGKLLVQLRSKNEVMLMALLGENTKFKFDNNVLTIISKNLQEYNALKKADNINTLNKALNEVVENSQIKIEYKEEKEEPSVEDLLKSKLGDSVKIKN